MDDPSMIRRVLKDPFGAYWKEPFCHILAKIRPRKGPRKDLVDE